jgi:hypothetical protein
MLLASTHSFSHSTAAILWGLPVPLDMLREETLHVTATGGAREPRRPGVAGHRSRDALVVQHLGLPVVSPLRAWAQCAETLAVDDLVVMGDALLSKWSPHGPARYRSMRERFADAGWRTIHITKDDLQHPTDLRRRLRRLLPLSSA